MNTPHQEDLLDGYAQRLHEARSIGVATPQLSDESTLTLEQAYEIQRRGIQLRFDGGERPIGVKLGLTSIAKAAQMGVKDVIIGVLTDTMQVAQGESLDISGGVHPRVEPEVAFRIARDIDPADPNINALTIADAVAPALEVIDSRYANFKFSLTDVVADNTSGSHFVVGQWRPVDSLELRTENDPAGRSVSLSINSNVAADGNTNDILDDPWNALPTTVRLAAQYGFTLRKGDILLAGAATAAVPLVPGEVSASVAGLGSVSLAIVRGSGQ